MTEQPAAAPAEEQEVKLGFLYLAPGISKANAYTFFYAAFMVIGLLTFVSTGTAQVLNALGVPLNEQGGVTGNLVIVTEIVQIAIFGVAGVAADRIGRRESERLLGQPKRGLLS